MTKANQMCLTEFKQKENVMLTLVNDTKQQDNKRIHNDAELFTRK